MGIEQIDGEIVATKLDALEQRVMVFKKASDPLSMIKPPVNILTELYNQFGEGPFGFLPVVPNYNDNTGVYALVVPQGKHFTACIPDIIKYMKVEWDLDLIEF